MRFDILSPVSQQHPVNRFAVNLGALFASIPDQFRVKTQFAHLVGFRVDLSDQIKIDKAVVNRCDQCICARCHIAGEFVVAARRIIEQKINPVRHPFDQLFEPRQIVIFEDFIEGLWNINIQPIHRRIAVFQIAIGCALAGIEIDDRDFVALMGKRNCDMNRGGGLAGPTLFIGEDDMMRIVGHVLSYTPVLGPCEGRFTVA